MRFDSWIPKSAPCMIHWTPSIQCNWASIGMHGAAQDYVLLLHIAPCGSCPYRTILWLLPWYMVKLKLIARNLTTWGDAPSHWGPGWHKIPGEYDTVDKAVDACREQQETLPEPWQFSIIVVEFDCLHPASRYPPWLVELTSDRFPATRFHGGRTYINTAQWSFLHGQEIGTPAGFRRPLPIGWWFSTHRTRSLFLFHRTLHSFLDPTVCLPKMWLSVNSSAAHVSPMHGCIYKYIYIYNTFLNWCLQPGNFHYKSKEACNFSEYKAKCFIRSTGCQHILIWYISGICHTTKHIPDQKKTILSILGDTCRRLVYVDEEGGRELKHQYLPYRNHYFWSRWLLRPAGRQARHLGLQNHCLGFRAGVTHIHIYIYILL